MCSQNNTTSPIVWKGEKNRFFNCDWKPLQLRFNRKIFWSECYAYTKGVNYSRWVTENTLLVYKCSIIPQRHHLSLFPWFLILQVYVLKILKYNLKLSFLDTIRLLIEACLCLRHFHEVQSNWIIHDECYIRLMVRYHHY